MPTREQPGVSYVMPVLNDAEYLEAAVASILSQDYPGPTEVLLALGPSSDGTDAIAARLQQADPRVEIVANPGTQIPIGLNLAIRKSSHPVIVRVDAHTELPAGYTKRAVDTLQETGAANVGGIMVAVGQPGLQAAIARAYNSRFGLGGGVYHAADGTPGPAESAYLGVMWADVLAEIGGFDESLCRGEDWELNYRIREAGHIVWLDPSLRVTYWPRATMAALSRQFYATGVWRGELVRRLRQRNSLRYFAPPLLVVASGAALALLPFAGRNRVLRAAAKRTAVGPAAYLALLCGVGAATRGSARERAELCGVLATMHYAWGFGFLVGAARGAGDTVDRSRVVIR